MSEQIKSIDDVLISAFNYIKRNHGVAVKSVDFKLIEFSNSSGSSSAEVVGIDCDVKVLICEGDK